MTVPLLKLHDWYFDLKFQQGKKVFVSDVLATTHFEADNDINQVIPANFLEYLNTGHINPNNKHLAHT